MLTYYADQESLPSTFPKNAYMIGKVHKVHDGDTLLFTPMTLFSLFNQKNSSRKSKISLRLAGIDAPETEKKGQAGQPFAVESREFLSQTMHKIILIKPFSKDQYGRLVGMAYDLPLLLPWFKRNLCLESVKRGLSVVYHGMGSEYGDLKKELMEAQKKASKDKKGIWSLPVVEMPGQFKKSQKNKTTI